jgi:hypothetical protein
LIDRKIDCKMLFQRNLVLQLVTPQQRRGYWNAAKPIRSLRRGRRA